MLGGRCVTFVLTGPLQWLHPEGIRPSRKCHRVKIGSSSLLFETECVCTLMF